jgi:hypothetical protein
MLILFIKLTEYHNFSSFSQLNLQPLEIQIKYFALIMLQNRITRYLVENPGHTIDSLMLRTSAGGATYKKRYSYAIANEIAK